MMQNAGSLQLVPKTLSVVARRDSSSDALLTLSIVHSCNSGFAEETGSKDGMMSRGYSHDLAPS